MVLATNCGPENVISGSGSKSYCIKGEAASHNLQVAPQEKEEFILKEGKVQEGFRDAFKLIRRDQF